MKIGRAFDIHDGPFAIGRLFSIEKIPEDREDLIHRETTFDNTLSISEKYLAPIRPMS
jgi:hypothetical protein